jgi:hypothetical protein
MYPATLLWWLPYVEIFFHGGLCSMHNSAKRVNIRRNSETENPIGQAPPILLPVAEKKQR